MVENEDNRPKWLLELENRKQKPRLAHEVGAGAPCMMCIADCPGLDLHFWRKICKNCKCGRDDHDVSNDEFPQFHLLLGPSARLKSKNIVLRINKQLDDEKTFEWAPPDTTKELAADYMKALPEDKLPIKGSVGAALRKQQLQKQLPLHDIDHKMCNALSDSERKQFEKYLENLKNYVGQGIVSKMMGARPFDRSLMTPANASECLSPKHNSSIATSQPSINLRIPSSFVPKSTYSSRSVSKSQDQLFDIGKNDSMINNPSVVQSRIENIYNPHLEQTANEPVNLGRYHHVLDNIKNDIQPAAKISNAIGNAFNPLTNCSPLNKISSKSDNPMKKILDTQNIYESNEVNAPIASQLQRVEGVVSNKSTIEGNLAKTPERSSNLQNESLINELLSDTLLSTNPIYNSDIIGSTLDREELFNIREKLMAKYSAKDKPIESLIQLDPSLSRDVRHGNLSENNPPSASSVSSYNSDVMLKPTQANITCYKNPDNTIIHSEMLQNPIFPDKAINSCTISNDNLESNFDNLSLNQTTTSNKIQQCQGCNEDIRLGDVIVTAERATNSAWHPGCFACCTCNELLVDLIYFYYKDKLYCARDLASLMEIPRCFACDELIFVREYTVAEGHNYHVKHFCCWDCDVPLADKQYVSENDRPLCLCCYQKTYAKKCWTCYELIAADQQGVAVKDLNFHATDACFCCYSCKKSLLNGKMAVKEEKLFCSKECITTYLNSK